MSWQDFLRHHQVGDASDGVVTKQVPFGSFVQADGVIGLAHQQTWSVDTHVSVRIVAVDTDRQRFSVEAA